MADHRLAGRGRGPAVGRGPRAVAAAACSGAALPGARIRGAGRVNPPASTTPFFNQRFAAFCVGIAVFAFVAWVAGKAPVAEGPPPSWPQ